MSRRDVCAEVNPEKTEACTKSRGHKSPHSWQTKRVFFCGVIEGSVESRPGETEDEARARAEEELNTLLARHARRFARVDDTPNGPVVGLEAP